MEERTQGHEPAGRAEPGRMGQPETPSVWISERFEQGAETVRRTIDEQRVAAARDLDQAAHRIRDLTGQTQGLPAQYADQAARRLEAGAEYLRETELPEMAESVKHTVRRYPWQSLAAATFVGFLLARMGRR